MMADTRGDGILGGCFGGNCAILFFILVFLILFTDFGGFGVFKN